MKYALFFLCLTACATAPSGASVCPNLRSYTKAEQLNQAAEEAFLPKDSALIDPLLEWASLRQQIRACQGE